MKFLWITRETPFAGAGGAQAYTVGLLRSLTEAGATGTLYVIGGGDPGLTTEEWGRLAMARADLQSLTDESLTSLRVLVEALEAVPRQEQQRL